MRAYQLAVTRAGILNINFMDSSSSAKGISCLLLDVLKNSDTKGLGQRVHGL